MISVVSVCLAMCSYVTTTQTCSNLFTWRSPILSPFVLPTSGPPCPQVSPPHGDASPRPVQTCSLCSPYIYRQAGSWPSTTKCLLVFHMFIRRIYLHKTDASSSLVRCSPHKGELMMWSWRIMGMYH